MIRKAQLTVRIERPVGRGIVRWTNEAARIHRIDHDSAFRRRVCDLSHLVHGIAAAVINEETTGEKEDDFSAGKISCGLDQTLETTERVLVEARRLRLYLHRARTHESGG